MWMNVYLTMNATQTPSVRTQTVATRAAVLMVMREMGRTAQVSVCVPLVQKCTFLNRFFFIANFAFGFNISMF